MDVYIVGGLMIRLWLGRDLLFADLTSIALRYHYETNLLGLGYYQQLKEKRIC